MFAHTVKRLWDDPAVTRPVYEIDARSWRARFVLRSVAFDAPESDENPVNAKARLRKAARESFRMGGED